MTKLEQDIYDLAMYKIACLDVGMEKDAGSNGTGHRFRQANAMKKLRDEILLPAVKNMDDANANKALDEYLPLLNALFDKYDSAAMLKYQKQIGSNIPAKHRGVFRQFARYHIDPINGNKNNPDKYVTKMTGKLKQKYNILDNFLYNRPDKGLESRYNNPAWTESTKDILKQLSENASIAPNFDPSNIRRSVYKLVGK